MTIWVTFVPCFIWIFLGAPHLERLRSRNDLSHALSAVTAAVVGVILNLGVWFAGPVLFPESSVDPIALAIATAAFLALYKFKVELLWVVLSAALLGLIRGGLFA